MFEKVASLIKEGNVVAFTGAGISVESGIPAFRGGDGLWQRYDPKIYATADGLFGLFRDDIESLKRFIIDTLNLIVNAKPNYAHFALKELEEKGYLIGVITQNIDNLHIEAGTRNISQVHGNIYVFICPNCRYSIKREKRDIEEFIKNLSKCHREILIKKCILKFLNRCPNCKSILRSNIVLFGEELPKEEIDKSYDLLNRAKTLMCIGTAGVVYPAASFPFYAYKRKTKIISVNIDVSSFDEISHFIFKEKASDFFKKLFFYL